MAIEHSSNKKGDVEKVRPPSMDVRYRHVVACVDTSGIAQSVLAHASAIAEIMEARLTLLTVLDHNAAAAPPVDPVSWDISLQGAHAELERLAAEASEIPDIGTVVCEGRAADQICLWVTEHDVDLIVMGTFGEHNWVRGGSVRPTLGLGGTVRRVAENTPSSLLLVPDCDTPMPVGQLSYRRVVVPLDSSSLAESCLPVARQIAEKSSAELLLVNAVPDVYLTRSGPLEAEAIRLRDQVRQRNERVAHRYLNRVLALTPKVEFRTRAQVLSEGDPREAIARLLSEENADLLIMSNRALSEVNNLAIGSTAHFLIDASRIPVLLTRVNTNELKRSIYRSVSVPIERQPGASRT